jgi:signal transduction histidine kinase
MLVLSRARSLEDVQVEPARLNHLAARAIEGFASRFPDRTVLVEVEAGLPLAEANPTYYEQILTNLLTNGHKYSPPGIPLRVRLATRGEMIETSVSDGGPGIPDDEIGRIFDPFYRTRAQSHIGGVGLGLTVCRRLTELQGGEITARNLPDGGCEFSFTTPAHLEVEV